MYLVRYDEITLKGKNRKQFENILFENIKFKARQLELNIIIHKKYGKFVIENSKKDEKGENDEKTEQVKQCENRLESILQTTPGIHSFAKVVSCSLSKEDIIQTAIEIVAEKTQPSISKKEFSFKVETKRPNKNFPMKSPEISQWLGGEILRELGGRESSSETPDSRHPISDSLISHSIYGDDPNPEIILFVNISEKETFLYLNKQLGIGGLPSRSLGRVISLLSGGIDSPVASIKMMQRGCEVILFYAYNHGIDTKSIKNKIRLLAQRISDFQGKVDLVMLPYRLIQKEIVGHIPGPYRMIAFKRSIVRVANILANKFNAKVIINGDSVGQVASQTLENIQCVYTVSELPILSPLIGMQKSDIIKLSRQFGTYNISVLPYDDCCSLIATGNPATRGSLERIEKYEQNTNLLDIEEVLTKKVDIINFVIK